ncbi:MAG: hypothetical protein OEV66_02920 [Spirochaetia bacterium]|nr:hypothetical protein [Spirochaetia bacterium]
MDTERYKMREFLGKLWMNPALQKATLDKKENQVLAFLRDNQAQLQKIFAQNDYFPNLSWNDAVKLLLTELVDKLLETITPKINLISQSIFSPAILKAFDASAEINPDKFKNFLIEQMRVKTLRDHYLSSIQIISLNYYSNYIPLAVERHKYIYNELLRHDRLKIDTTLLPSYISLATLFRPLFHYPIKYRDDSDESASLAKATTDRKLYDTLLQKLRVQIYNEIGNIPEVIFLPGIQSNLMLADFPEISGSARLIAVLAARSADYIPVEKRDRGAESPDKSWFQINRRNAKIYGLDADMMDELYQIAGEKGW